MLGELLLYTIKLYFETNVLVFGVVKVIDEIDGALGEGKGAVEVILKMVTLLESSS